MIGTALNDNITGDNGDNTIYVGAGDNTVDAGTGNDTVVASLQHIPPGFGTNRTANNLAGGIGEDTLVYVTEVTGGSATHSITIDFLAGTVSSGLTHVSDNISGFENAVGTNGVDTLRGDFGHNRLYGMRGNDGLLGGFGNDTLEGDTAADSVAGLGGMDQILGGDGNDIIIGGGNADTLNGGAGSDLFVYRDWISDCNFNQAPEQIEDFSRAQGDKIDLSQIDAKLNSAGDQAFTFLGFQTSTSAFTGAGGEAYSTATNFPGSVAVYCDTNGDRFADMRIIVTTTDALSLQASDFVL